jgi:hypothetical protein
MTGILSGPLPIAVSMSRRTVGNHFSSAEKCESFWESDTPEHRPATELSVQIFREEHVLRHRLNRYSRPRDRFLSILARVPEARRMLGTMMRTAVHPLVKRLDSGVSGGGLCFFGCQVPWWGRHLILAVFVTELRGTVARLDGQVHALTASVPVYKSSIEVFRIGRIRMAKPVPGFSNAIQA